MTAKMVRLPAELGGAEVESVGGAGVPLTVWGKPADVVKVPGVGWVAVPISALSEVKPPLPPEPREFSTVRIGCRAYVRDDRIRDHLNWYGPDGRKSWEELCAESARSTGFPPVVLVPAPEPVTLPWHLTSINGWGGGGVRLARDNHAAPVGYSLEDQVRYMTTAQARQMAYALLSAADQAEGNDDDRT